MSEPNNIPLKEEPPEAIILPNKEVVLVTPPGESAIAIPFHEPKRQGHCALLYGNKIYCVKRQNEKAYAVKHHLNIEGCYFTYEIYEN